jgi:alpha-tubulin suppressor-like RCC1 family protein
VRVETTLRFRSISAGMSHTCAVSTDGAAYCWGSNVYGELGNAGRAEAGMTGSPWPDPTRLGYTFETVSAGEWFTCGAVSGGPGRCWGRGLEGQLGNAQPLNTTVPLSTFDGVSITFIAAGLRHACALGPGDEVHCWGDGTRGQLGRPRGNTSLTPSRVNIPRD